jgi:C1A family cysteine protease
MRGGGYGSGAVRHRWHGFENEDDDEYENDSRGRPSPLALAEAKHSATILRIVSSYY